MDDTRKALELARDWFDENKFLASISEVIAAIDAALKEPAAPVAQGEPAELTPPPVSFCTVGSVVGSAAPMLGLKPDDGLYTWAQVVKHIAAATAAPVAQGEPVAWLRNLTDPQPHAVTSLKYRSAADVDAGVEYVPVYAAPQPARELRSLTDEQIDVAVNSEPDALYYVMHCHEITVSQFRIALHGVTRATIAEFCRVNGITKGEA